MARKFIQMGYTRARRYANHKGGKSMMRSAVKPLDHDPVKAEAAAVFKTWWDKIRADEDYLQRKGSPASVGIITTSANNSIPDRVHKIQ